MGSKTSTQPRTQEQRTADSRRKIIRAAIELYAKQGYMRTTVSEIGKAAGYTGGLVSHRFGTKESLLKAVVEHMSGRYLVDQLEPNLKEKDPEQAIRDHIEIYFNELLTRKESMRSLYVVMGESLGAVPEIQKEIAHFNKGVRAVLSKIIRRGVEAGTFRKNLDAEATAILILGLLRGITMQALADKTISVKELVPLVQAQVLASLKP